MKPSQTPETTAVFFIFLASFITVANTSFAVAAPRTTSSNFITFAGLKKCSPITSCGRLVKFAIRFKSSVDVLLARIAPGFMTVSSVLNTFSFTLISSNTASMTRSAFLIAAYSSVGVNNAIRCSHCSCESLPRLTVFSKFFRMVATPLSSASCFISSMVTGIPALRKFMLIPPPMVPAPMTATVLIGRVCVVSGTSDIFDAARSAKNACRRAADSGVATSSENSWNS